jgi:SAM-dependent methyltransferase
VTGAGVHCRSCDGANLDLVLSLGRTPLANALLTQKQLSEPETTFPLDLVFCQRCSLVQITETVPPKQLFGNYLYLTSFSDTMLSHSEDLVTQLMKSRRLNSNSRVVEVASNDGYLLQYYKKAGVPVLGIEPAANIAKVAEDRGIPTLPRFFDLTLARELRDRDTRADVIHANNVLAHVANLNGFVAGLALVLKENGLAVLEVPHVMPMVERLEFDTIYHEHLCYFSLSALQSLFERHRLAIVDVVEIPLHGGSLQVHVAHSGRPSDRVSALLERERAAGVDRLEFYREFGAKVERLKDDLRAMLEDLKASGSKIAAYGASAKGSTLLNYCNIGRETLDFVVDRSTLKQGYYTPGMHLPIKAPEALLEELPSHVLLLTWNFADEILKQQSAYRKQGGHFIIPVPEPSIV